MQNQDIPLLALHGALSAIPFAVKESMPDVPMDCWVEWRNHTHLSVKVEVQGRWVQRVVDQLSAGVVPGNYDYRFKMISRPTNYDNFDFVTISAMLLLSNYPSEDKKLMNWAFT